MILSLKEYNLKNDLYSLIKIYPFEKSFASHEKAKYWSNKNEQIVEFSIFCFI